MSDQSGTADGQQPTTEAPESKPTEPEAPPAWLGPIQERMDELGEQTGRMAEQLSGFYQGGDEGEDEGLDEDFDYYDDDGELTPEGAQALIDQRVDERLQATLSQRDAARALEEREDAFDALRDEISALQDDKLAARLVNETAQWCLDHGHEDLIDTPAFVDLIEDRYYREQYREHAAAERDGEHEHQREVVLESASGASQPSARKEPDWGDRIVKAAERLRPQI